MKIVKFKYCNDFHCIGPDCLDYCCKNWDIFFGKRDYLNYKNINCSPELKKALNGAFERVRDHEKRGLVYNESKNYAKIKFKENGDCPLYGSDGLCMLQKELGEKALGHVCNIYPRLYGSVGNEAFIMGLNITCSHVCELLIAHPEGLELAEEEYDGSGHGVDRGLLSLGLTRKEWAGYPQYWRIKGAQIDILQNRNFTISERLLILGFFSKKADEYIETDQVEKISTLYNMILDNEFCKSIADSLKADQSEASAAAKSVDQFLKMYNWVHQSTNDDTTNHLFRMYEQAAQSINAKTDRYFIDGVFKSESNFDMRSFSENLKTIRSIEDNRGYILENIFVNMIFVSPPHMGVFKSFFKLAIFYNILKICLPAFLKEDWNDKGLALAISYSAKMVDNTKMAEMISKRDLEKHESFDLPHIAFLIS